jgi:hypothetical protein
VYRVSPGYMSQSNHNGLLEVRPLWSHLVDGKPQLQSPGAGPSRISIEAIEDQEREECMAMTQYQADLPVLRLQREYTELSDSVDTSTELLSSLASYLSTFQNDLSAVSGQIADLQSRSADIDSQLRGRKVRLVVTRLTPGNRTTPSNSSRQNHSPSSSSTYPPRYSTNI